MARGLFFLVLKIGNSAALFLGIVKVPVLGQKRPNMSRGFNRSGPRETFKATCSDCGQECDVPFKPTQGKPVYCNECFKKHKKPRY